MFYDGERVRLRPPERSDLKQFVSWLSNPAQRPYITVRYISEALEERWFERLLDAMSGPTPSTLHFVIETHDGHVPIGMVSLDAINWRDRDAEVGIIIGESAQWGHGYGSDAMCTILLCRLPVVPASPGPSEGDRRQRPRHPQLREVRFPTRGKIAGRSLGRWRLSRCAGHERPGSGIRGGLDGIRDVLWRDQTVRWHRLSGAIRSDC